MDLLTINDAIQALEEEPTTVENVSELASLYICKANLETSLKNDSDVIPDELDDILPYYMKYRDIKKRYQLNQAIDGEVIQGIKDVCRELKEFVDMLFYGTDMNKERLCIREMIKGLYEKYSE